jgi:uncharacterized protein
VNPVNDTSVVEPKLLAASQRWAKAQARLAHLTVAELRECLTPVFQRHGILKAIVFGSVARGEPSPYSDVDLILVQRTEKRFLDRYEGLDSDLYKAFPYAAIELFIYTPEEIERMQERRFIARALREGKLIYESE